MGPKTYSNKEIQKFKDITDIFFKKVLGQEVPTLTDASSLTDFSPNNDIEKSVGPGSKPGLYKFKAEFCYTDENGKDVEKVSEWEESGVDYYQEVVDKTLAVFRVDVSSVVDEPIVKILQFIVDNYTGKQVH